MIEIQAEESRIFREHLQKQLLKLPKPPRLKKSIKQHLWLHQLNYWKLQQVIMKALKIQGSLMLLQNQNLRVQDQKIQEQSQIHQINHIKCGLSPWD